jgi:hypothetical protein
MHLQRLCLACASRPCALPEMMLPDTRMVDMSPDEQTAAVVEVPEIDAI